jgi:hypothetical protein
LRGLDFFGPQWPPSRSAKDVADNANIHGKSLKSKQLALDQASLVSAAAHSRVRELHMIIFPAAQIADLVAARRLAEDEEPAARAREGLFTHGQRYNEWKGLPRPK